MLAREFVTHAADTHELVGFVDDNVALQGTAVESVPVLGDTASLVEQVAQHDVDEVVIAVPSAERQFVRRIVGLCRDAQVPYRIVPGLLEIIRGPVRLEQIRDLRPEDLLGREAVDFTEDDALRDWIRGKRVLVTGAGGSIGSEMCRQLARLPVDTIFLLGRGENQVFDIEQDLRARNPQAEIVPVIADIRDADHLRRRFSQARPDLVFHAAAHKHVHYMEAFPDEAVRNNVFGTLNVIDASVAVGAERVVMLSTDKAVHPMGVMGASKRFAEYLMKHRTGDTKLISVRFGNVLASRGSVVPIFVRQIQRGGPVTVSDPEATRYFMSIREACVLVVHAAHMGRGGDVFILQMGEPINIMELARDLIALHGLKPDTDIQVQVTGLRPGEKLHEGLVCDGEKVDKSEHPYIVRATSEWPSNLDIDSTLERLRSAAVQGDVKLIRDVLNSVIPDAELE